MAYVLDTNAFSVFGHYYRDSFPSFWENLDRLVAEDRITSIRQVEQELERYNANRHIREWVSNHESLFVTPSSEVMEGVREIFAVPHFQQMIGEKRRLGPRPVADPWVIARAWELDGCVVSEETPKPNSAQIPNVCDHFGVECCKVSGMLQREGWVY